MPWHQKTMKDALKIDRARSTVGRLSPNGLLEINRQRIQQSLRARAQRPCPTCQGTGRVPSIESVIVEWAEDKGTGDLDAVKAMLAGGGPLITTPSWNQVQTLSMQFGAEATNGNKSAEEILTQIQQSAQG